MTKWWLSFVDEETDTFKGVCIVEADGFLLAVLASKVHGCNPGGQVAGWPFPDSLPEDSPELALPMNKLLSKLDLEPTGSMSIRELEKQRSRPT